MKEQWDSAGKQIKDIVQSAIEDNDFSRLSQNIGDVINDAIDAGKANVTRTYTSSTIRNTTSTTQRVYKSGENRYTNQNKNASAKANPFPRVYATNVPGRIAGMLGLVLGIIMVLAFGIALIVLGTMLAVFGYPALVAACIVSAILAAFGCGLTVYGGKNLALVKAFDRVRQFMGNREFCKVQELADAMGKDRKKLTKQLRKMVAKRMFLQGHVDENGEYLMVTNKIYDQYQSSQAQYKQREYNKMQEEKARMEEEKKYKLDEASRKVIDEGERYIKHIHLCNDKLPEEMITRKLSRLEAVVDRIFTEVKKRPELAGDLNKMMNYYLPTTQKLLDVYVQLEQQDMQGENIIKSKREIEDSLDTINSAFEKLLDSFFADTAMDVSSDISVLQTMLAQEGLTESDFEKQKQQMQQTQTAQTAQTQTAQSAQAQAQQAQQTE